MLTKEKTQEIFERAKKYTTADEFEVLISGGQSALTRFANNTIHQNVAEENYVVSVRTVFGGRTARATTNRFDDESLRRTVKASESIAKVQEPDPDLLPMAGAEADSGAAQPGRAFFETSSLTPEQRAKGVEQIVGVAKGHKLTTAGIFASSESVEAVLNSRGLFAFHNQTSSEISITMLAPNSSGWQKANSPDVRNLQPVALAEIAARKALESAEPRELAPGKYSVILEPAAVLDLVGFMFWDFGGMAILDQRSFLNNRVGTKIFGDNITIHDDVAHPLQSGAPFDGEGCQKSKVALIENGVFRNVVSSRISQHRYGAAPTGHELPLPNPLGELPTNLVIRGKGATKTSEELIGELDKGLLITRFWYVRETEPRTKTVTGMTRDGTFLVENGEIKRPVKNLRFNQSLLELFNKVDAVSEPVRNFSEFQQFRILQPGILARDFNFTSVSPF